MMKKIMLIASSVIALSGLVPTVAQAIPFSQISQVYFFGDSLTDSGYNDLWTTDGGGAPLPTFKAPTFTTYGGYTWAQYIARDIKGFVLPVYSASPIADTITNNTTFAQAHFASGTLTGIDYAAGGSTTNSVGILPWAPSLHSQVSQYLSTAPATLDPNAVYFIWSAANDIFETINAASPGFPSQLDLLTAVNTAAMNIGGEVARLSARGAKRVVVLSLPNIGHTPYIIAASGAIPTLPADMKNLVSSFNGMLNQQLGNVIATYGTKVLYVDTFTLLDSVISASNAGQPYVVAGQSFNFTNVTSPECVTLPASPLNTAIYCISSENAPGYLFADGIHPTDMAHRVLSLEVEQEIQNWS